MNIFRGIKDIKYLLVKEESSEELVVIFSEYNLNEKKANSFTGVEELKNLKCNKLFILDDHGYKNRGCWYLGENGRSSVESSIIKLIIGIIKTLRIKRSNIILYGIRSGGFASIYYGIKYKFKNVISISPPILLGNHLKAYPPILEGIIGNGNIGAINILNNIIIGLKPEMDTYIYAYCGNRDIEIQDGIEKLKQRFPNKNNVISKSLMIDEQYIGEKFNGIASQLIVDILEDNYNDNVIDSIGEKSEEVIFTEDEKMEFKKNLNVNYSNTEIVVNMNPYNNKYLYACHLMKECKVVEKVHYKRNPEFHFAIKELADYKVVIYIRHYETEKIVVMNVPLKFEIDIDSKVNIRQG